MKTIIINIKNVDKSVTIDKLPLKKYADVLKRVKNIYKIINFIYESPVDHIVDNLWSILEDGSPDLLEIIKISVDDQLTDDEVEKLGLSECIDLLYAIYEVNNYKQIYDLIKKAFPQFSKNKETKQLTNG